MEESEEELKSLLMKVNEESEKVLKLDIQQTKIEASSPISSLQFISFSQLSPTLCNPMDSSMPGFPVHNQLPELTQIHVRRVSDAIQPSHPLPCPSPLAFNLSQHQSFQMSQFFPSGGQNIGASASTSVLPMNIQD